MTAVPFERYIDLSDVPGSGYEARIAATPQELRQLAEWAGVDEVCRLTAHVSVQARSRTRFILETEFAAEIVQSCVVTLEPVRSRLTRSFARTLHLSPARRRAGDNSGEVAPLSADDDTAEEIESARFDLAGPLREEFVLAIDPYPRARGVEFASPDDAVAPESPFAVLRQLKSGG